MPHIRDFEPVLPDPQPYTEKALALYNRAVRDKRGRVVFIAAELGGGKTELLGAIAKALHEAQPAPNFVAGFFSGGKYKPYALQENVSLRKTIATGGQISALVSFVPLPFLSALPLIGQLIETCVEAHEWSDELNKSPQEREEHADRLKKKLRRAAEEKPLICLLDDWDEAQRFYWDSMLFSFSREIARDLPVLLFITVKEPINLHAPDKDESGLTEVIKSLTEKGLAELWTLRKLTRDEVAAAIGQAAPGIAAKLHGVTGGNARWVKELWREWRLNEIVVTDEADRWMWSHPRGTSMSLYKDILEDRLKRVLKDKTAMKVEQAREVLACAALEGVHFTADAVALALGWDRDELIDLLDELVQTDDNPDGLLLEDGSISIPATDGAPRTLWLYRFVSDLHWMAMERFGFANEQRPERDDTERLEKSIAITEALMEVYATEERFVAAPLARLLREVGNKEVAKHYQQMADYGASREVMRDQALNLLAINKDDWEQWQCKRTAEFLRVAGRSMTDAFPYHETLSVFEEACNLARRAKDRYGEAWAHYYCCLILKSEGDNRSASARANESLNIFLLIREKSGEANALLQLADIDYAEGKGDGARKRAEKALKIGQETGNRREEAAALFLLAWMDYEDHKHDDAREPAEKALKIDKDIGNRRGEAAALHLLAQIDEAEGRYDDMLGRAEQLLEIVQEIGDRRGEAAALHLLARIDEAEGKYDDARGRAEQALRIDKDVGYPQGEAVALLLLARIEHAEGKYDDPLERAEQSLKIAQQIGSRRGEAAALHLLGAVASEFERKHEAFILMSLSLLIHTQLRHIDAKEIERLLAELNAKYKYSDEQQELYNQVSEAYRKDGGKELIENALVRLREPRN